MRRPRLFGPLVIAPVTVAAAAGLVAWVWSRWGYGVRTAERDVRRAPRPPVDTSGEAPSARAIQSEDEGSGPRVHRTYRVTVRDATLSPEALIERIEADIQAFVPDELARFEKVTGVVGTLAVGDEFDIHISAPWDGPVRVIDRDAVSFTFGTLEGHLEAGQIRFRAERHEAVEGGLRFTIESWARSRDAVVDAVYDDLGLAKAAQQAMWTFFCQRVVEASEGTILGEVAVVTEREARS